MGAAEWPVSAPTPSSCASLALSMPPVNPGFLYRCGKSNLEQAVGHGRRKEGLKFARNHPRRGKWEVLEVLLAAGARPGVPDLDGETALMWAKNYTDNDASGKCVTILEAACVNMMTHP